MGMLIVLGFGVVISVAWKAWRVKQFQKATGMSFFKAWFVLGK